MKTDIRPEQIELALYHAADELNRMQPDCAPLVKSLDTVLFGRSGALDSLGLINFVKAVEEKMEDDLGVMLTLVNERAMSKKDSPFKTMGTFRDHISLLLKEQVHD